MKDPDRTIDVVTLKADDGKFELTLGVRMAALLVGDMCPRKMKKAHFRRWANDEAPKIDGLTSTAAPDWISLREVRVLEDGFAELFPSHGADKVRELLADIEKLEAKLAPNTAFADGAILSGLLAPPFTDSAPDQRVAESLVGDYLVLRYIRADRRRHNVLATSHMKVFHIRDAKEGGPLGCITVGCTLGGTNQERKRVHGYLYVDTSPEEVNVYTISRRYHAALSDHPYRETRMSILRLAPRRSEAGEDLRGIRLGIGRNSHPVALRVWGARLGDAHAAQVMNFVHDYNLDADGDDENKGLKHLPALDEFLSGQLGAMRVWLETGERIATVADGSNKEAEVRALVARVFGGDEAALLAFLTARSEA